MGYVYYGFYSLYYEVGRTEMIRELGVPYTRLEEDGIIMPVTEMSIKYVIPARYDQLLTIHTVVEEMPTVRMKFKYELTNEDGDIINIGRTTLAFIIKETMKPCRPPDYLVEKLKPFFK